jgi:WD40 repeat protein
VTLHPRFATWSKGYPIALKDVVLRSKNWVEIIPKFSIRGDDVDAIKDHVIRFDVPRADTHLIYQNVGKNSADTTDTITLLHDCERFARQFFAVISTSSLQVYHSALLSTPNETLIYKTYQQELVVPVKLLNGSEPTWDSCMRTMDGHSESINSVAFSPDGTRVVSGSHDNTVQLWDAVSGTHLNMLEGHSGPSGSCSTSLSGGVAGCSRMGPSMRTCF